MDVVLDNYELMSIIWSYLDVPTIGVLASVSPMTFRLYKELYKKRLDKEYIEPCKLKFEQYMEKISIYVTTLYPTIDNENKHSVYIKHTVTLTNYLIKDNNWLAIINDFDLMESMFYYFSQAFEILSYHLKYVRSVNNLNLETYKNYEIMIRNLNKIKRYLYVVYPNNYNVKELSMMAKFKNIKKIYKRNRSSLIASLRRPKDEIYAIQ